MRECGVLLPIFSLPGKYGIGCFSKEAYRFVDFLVSAGQSLWQILPIGTNWRWRVKAQYLDAPLSRRILTLTRTYGR